MNRHADSTDLLDTDDRVSSTILRTSQILIVVIATLLHTVFLSKAKPLQSANDRSRWCTVWSLVERGTFQIDEIRQRPGWDTIDMVHVDDHYYSTKPPLLTSIVAGITWCLQRITGWNLFDHLQPLTFLVLLLVNIVPFAASLLIWIAILNRCSLQPWTRLFGLAIAAFGTLLTPFLMTLNNHTVAAASTMFTIYALIRILQSDDESRPGWAFALCGLSVAWTAANELPAFLLVAISFVLAYRSSPRQTFLYFLPAAAIPLIAFVASNVIATGSVKPTYADYGTDKYRFVIDGVPSYWMNPQGVDRNLDKPLSYLFHCTFGHHGLFSLTPIALFALLGWLSALFIRTGSSDFDEGNLHSEQDPLADSPNRKRTLRTLLWLGLLVSTVVVAFYLTRTQNYNFGGVSCGLRWALWLTPLWLVGIVPVLDLCAKSRIARVIAVVLGLASMYSAWQPIDNPWRQPWLFQYMENRGWIDYSDPQVELKKPLWTWFASVPESADGEPAWIEFTVAQSGLTPRTVRLTAQPVSKDPQNTLIKLEVQNSWGDSKRSDSDRTLLIDALQFNQGAPPADFLRWDNPNVTSEQQQSDLAFVRGLPRKVPYEARVMRYLKTPLRREALHCVQAAAHVTFGKDDSEKPMNHRCDVWLSDDVPFGVAQVEFRVSDPQTGATLFQERWTVKACSPKVKPYSMP